MGITEEGKKAVAKADAELTKLADMVTRKGATKWVVLGLVLAVFALLAIALWPAKAHATGGHVPPVVVVKPPVVVPPPAPPPVVVAPTGATVTPPAAPPAAPSTPSPQPSAGGNGPGALGWYVMAGVAIYFGAVIRTHWLFCAEDDRKPPERRVCYRPLRDGMPK